MNAVIVRLKPSVIARIRRHKNVKLNLGVKLEKTGPTIQNYLSDNNIMLTTVDALRVISEDLGLPIEQLTEEIYPRRNTTAGR